MEVTIDQIVRIDGGTNSVIRIKELPQPDGMCCGYMSSGVPVYANKEFLVPASWMEQSSFLKDERAHQQLVNAKHH